MHSILGAHVVNTEPIALLVHCMRKVSVHVCIYLNAVFLLQFGKTQVVIFTGISTCI